jgi:hypothetical protein
MNVVSSKDIVRVSEGLYKVGLDLISQLAYYDLSFQASVVVRIEKDTVAYGLIRCKEHCCYLAHGYLDRFLVLGDGGSMSRVLAL